MRADGHTRALMSVILEGLAWKSMPALVTYSHDIPYNAPEFYVAALTVLFQI